MKQAQQIEMFEGVKAVVAQVKEDPEFLAHVEAKVIHDRTHVYNTIDEMGCILWNAKLGESGASANIVHSVYEAIIHFGMMRTSLGSVFTSREILMQTPNFSRALMGIRSPEFMKSYNLEHDKLTRDIVDSICELLVQLGYFRPLTVAEGESPKYRSCIANG